MSWCVVLAVAAAAQVIAAAADTEPAFITTQPCVSASYEVLVPRPADGAIVDAAGRCLSAVPAGDFTAVAAVDCGPSPPAWTWHADGTVEYAATAGQCLNVNAALKTPNASLILWSCTPPGPNGVFRVDAAASHIVAVQADLCLSEAAPPVPVPGAKGYLDAVADCGADASGNADATAPLRACFAAAYRYGSRGQWPVPVFFPLGTYAVSDTLALTQANPGGDDGVNVCPARFLAVAAFGSAAALPARPVLRLAAASPGFNATSRGAYKPVVHISCSAGEGVDMNSLWVGIDVDLTAPGNPGAVGIAHAGAQGATVSDVTVRAGADTFACFAGLNGAGGEHANVWCLGARYGVWIDDSQPVPVLVGATLVGQNISAIHYASQETLSLVGVRIVAAAGATGPAIASAGGNRAMSIVDTTIDCSDGGSAGGGVGISTAASLYLRDVYVRGCGGAAVAQASTAPLPGVSGWLHVSEWARGTDTGPFFYSNVIYTDGARHDNASVRAAAPLPAGEEPPLDLQSRHVWTQAQAAAVGPDAPGAANARSACGAAGDDATDDTAALQRCLDAHALVFLPPGRFRISAPLQLRAGGALTGMGAAFSFLLAATGGFPNASVAAPLPMVRTSADDGPGSAAGPTTLAFLGVGSWQHLPHVYTLDWRSAQPLSLWRANFEFRECECLWTSAYQRTAPPDIPCALPANLSVAKSVFRGLGRVHGFVNDDTGAILSTGAAYRSLLVADTAALAGPAARTRFYSLNLEHGQAEANGEVANASWVDVYSIKGEGNLPLLWLRSDVANVSLLGLGGGFTAWPANWTFPPDFAPATPSALRVDAGARGVTLAVLQDHGQGQSRFWPPTRGDCRWGHAYPFPGAAVAAYPFWTYPNVTMWNCWYGYTVSDAYWSMVTQHDPASGGAGDAATQPGDKPVLWRLS